MIVELIFIFIIAIIPRTWGLFSDLQIHFDQGLHSESIWKIWHDGNMSLLGHQTDVDGIFHAPIYYWLMLPFYVLGRGDPVYPAVWQAITHAFSAVLIYILSCYLFDKKTARYSAFLFATSYGFISFSRWLSNVNPVIPFSLVFFIVLKRSHEKPVFWLPIAVFLCSLIIEFNGAIGVFLLPVLFIFCIRLIRSLAALLLVALAFVIPHLPLLLFNLRHGFVTISAILNYTASSSTGLGLDFSTLTHNLRELHHELAKIFVWPFEMLLPVLLFLLLWTVLNNRRRPSLVFLLSGLLLPILSLFLYRRGAIGFFYWAVLPLFVLLVSYALTRLRGRLGRVIFVFLVGLNIFHWHNFLQPGFALTPIGTNNLITHSDRKRVVDWIYSRAAGRPIYLWIYTIPYLLDDPWRYYFVYHGSAKYRHLPVVYGGSSPSDIPKNAAFFAIYEPDKDRPLNLAAWQNRLQSEFPALIDRTRFHDALVEFRK